MYSRNRIAAVFIRLCRTVHQIKAPASSEKNRIGVDAWIAGRLTL